MPRHTRISPLVTADALVTRRYVRLHSPKFVGELLFRRCRPDRHGRTRVFAARRRRVGAQQIGDPLEDGDHALVLVGWKRRLGRANLESTS